MDRSGRSPEVFRRTSTYLAELQNLFLLPSVESSFRFSEEDPSTYSSWLRHPFFLSRNSVIDSISHRFDVAILSRLVYWDRGSSAKDPSVCPGFGHSADETV